MDGTLRIGHILGTSKIILNAVSTTKDFYVNGDSEINGNFLATSIDSSNYIKGSSLISNTINADNINDIFFLKAMVLIMHNLIIAKIYLDLLKMLDLQILKETLFQIMMLIQI